MINYSLLLRPRTSVYDFTVYELPFLHFWHAQPVKIQSIIINDNNNYSGGNHLSML